MNTGALAETETAVQANSTNRTDLTNRTELGPDALAVVPSPAVPQALMDVWEFMDDEERADALLQYHGAIDRSRGVRMNRGNGVYTEKQLADHSRCELTNTDRIIHLYEVATVELADMLQSEVEEVTARAPLTERQQAVWSRLVCGYSYQEIADDCGFTRQRARYLAIRARFVILEMLAGHPYYGWYEVYLSEVMRKKSRKSVR